MKQTSSILTAVFAAVLLLSGNAHAVGIDEDVMRNLFQEIKTYLGLMQGNEREHENLLRAVPPPDYKLSAKVGDIIKQEATSPQMQGFEDDLVKGSIIWNMLQTPEEVNNSKLVMRHLGGYCSEDERDAGLCKVGLTIEQGGAADLLADTLLAHPTITQNGGALAYIYNLTNSTPIPLPENTFASDQFVNIDTSDYKYSAMNQLYGGKVGIRQLSADGIRTLSTRYKQMTLLSTAQYALNQILSERKQVLGLGKAIGMDKEDSSIFEALKFEATRRFTDEDWHNSIYESPDTALLREIANMQAVQLALDFKRYEQEQTLITLLAAQVSNIAQNYGATEAAHQMQ